MKPKDENEKLIGKLIKKRKQENEAFIKLLSAIEIKDQANEEKKTKGKTKS
jgi:hypothetical protein